MKHVLFLLVVSVFVLAVTAYAQPVTSDSSNVVPIQNPWNVRPGVDSAMLIPAAQARQLTEVVMERNACVDDVAMYRELVQKHAALHVLDSSSIVNLKQQVATTDTLRQLQLAAAKEASASKWTYGFAGFGIGSAVTTVSAVLIVLLSR